MMKYSLNWQLTSNLVKKEKEYLVSELESKSCQGRTKILWILQCPTISYCSTFPKRQVDRAAYFEHSEEWRADPKRQRVTVVHGSVIIPTSRRQTPRKKRIGVVLRKIVARWSYSHHPSQWPPSTTARYGTDIESGQWLLTVVLEWGMELIHHVQTQYLFSPTRSVLGDSFAVHSNL